MTTKTATACKSLECNIARLNFHEYTFFGFTMVVANDGYINASALCKTISEKENKTKSFRTLQRSEKWNELIAAYEERYGVTAIRVVKDVPIALRGYYIHPDLTHHVAEWASIRYSLIVADVMKKIHERNTLAGRDTTNEIIEKLQEENEELKQKLIDSGVQIGELNTRAVPVDFKNAYMVLINETDVAGKYRVTKRVMHSLNAKLVRELEQTAIIKKFHLPIGLSFAKEIAKVLGLTYKKNHFIGVTEENLKQIQQYLDGIPPKQ